MNSRRAFGLAAAGCVVGPLACGKRRMRPAIHRSRVSVIRAGSYAAEIGDLILRGLRECQIDVAGKAVLVKPNLVEYSASAPVHTDAAVLAGCVAALEKLGARTVTIGEGPGHRRDTLGMANAAGYLAAVPRFESRFVDLNLDDVSAINSFADERRFYLPNTALSADLIVSLAKMKTHHWVGATLCMKNLFGLVPGAIYGWPKNKLHFLGIERAIGALYRAFPRTIGIVDGIVGMEGNGPIQGSAHKSGVLVIGENLPAVDATCCRLMGIDATQIDYLSAEGMGTLSATATIEQRGEDPTLLAHSYQLLPALQHLKLRS